MVHSGCEATAFGQQRVPLKAVKTCPLIQPARLPCTHCRHNTTAGPSATTSPSLLLCPPWLLGVTRPCHAPGHLATAYLAVRSPAGPELGLFPRGALEPRVSDPRSPGRYRAGLSQLGALSAAVPRNHRAPELPEGPHCAVVSVISVSCQHIKGTSWLKYNKMGFTVRSQWRTRDTSSPGLNYRGKLCVRLRVRLWDSIRWGRCVLKLWEHICSVGFIFVNDTSDEMSATGSSVASPTVWTWAGRAGRANSACRVKPRKSSIQSRSFSYIVPLFLPYPSPFFPLPLPLPHRRLETKLVFKTILNTSFTMRPDTIDCECEPVY